MIGLATCAVVTIAAAPPPTSRPAATRAAPTAPASRAVRAEDPIRSAVTALTREAQDAARRRAPFPRAQPDYFADKSATIDPSELLKALQRRVSQDPRIDAYVKWQLLSGVPTFDGALAREAIGAYANASPIIPLPGLSEQERQRWVQQAQRAQTQDACEKVMQAWEEERKPYIEANEPILTYREAIRARIAPTDEDRPRLLRAQFEDLSQRAAAGLDVDDALTALSGEVRAWATLAKRGAIQDMANFARDYGRREGATVNDKLVWYSTQKRATWRTRKAELDEKKLDKLIDALDAQAQQAPQ